ncbi:MAG: phenylalanine--tRNA ligase subunit alpha [Spirochaetia bacterium]|nr:phenylalanine--tRNA ligase subunit alpha [Spirochaetota bacterium]MDW8112548.1 phenylalanine--tRNA ligase subunit alpha [Spirochaetia bacterium]
MDIQSILEKFNEEINSTEKESDLLLLKSKYVGGTIKELFRKIKEIDPSQRKDFGQKINELKDTIESRINEKIELIRKKSVDEKLKSEWVDITLTRSYDVLPSLHPVNIVKDELCRIFSEIGFSIVEGPEIELESYNFDKLNIPPNHPARDDHDSFYLNSKDVVNRYLLRTQTSPVQIRVMEKYEFPVAIVAPGRCFRRDTVDARHSHTFHQIEGLYVNNDVKFSDLKGVMDLFAKKMFGPKTRTRFRADFFPFTEPSAELAVTCPGCSGSGCSVCSHTGWLEIAGCGMVHPKVFENAGYDPTRVKGFAFGMGIERIAMVKYNITDIRLFYENDIRFLKQFLGA